MDGNLYCTYMNVYYTVWLLPRRCKSLDVRAAPGHVQLNSEILSSHVYLVLEYNTKACLIYSLKKWKTTCRVRQWWCTSYLSHSLLRTAICSVHSPSLTLTLTSGKRVRLALDSGKPVPEPVMGEQYLALQYIALYTDRECHITAVYNSYRWG